MNNVFAKGQATIFIDNGLIFRKQFILLLKCYFYIDEISNFKQPLFYRNTTNLNYLSKPTEANSLVLHDRFRINGM